MTATPSEIPASTHLESHLRQLMAADRVVLDARATGKDVVGDADLTGIDRKAAARKSPHVEVRCRDHAQTFRDTARGAVGLRAERLASTFSLTAIVPPASKFSKGRRP